MANNYYFIDDSVSAGSSTMLSIRNESATFGIGATSGILATSLGIAGLSTTQNLIVTGITTVGLGTTSAPSSNSQMSFELTSNTNLRIKVRGSDGILRSANITLA
jgi:hypothetical protein